MIVRKSSKGLHLIHQASHGLLAGKIAEQLKTHLKPAPWIETLVAIIEHDDHQLDFDEKNYLSKLGVPLDFTENTTTTRKVVKRAKRVFEQAKSKSLWTALLVSLHLEYLYGDLKDKHKKAKKFLKEQSTFREKNVSKFKMSLKDLKNQYQVLLFCDRCSLILCKDEIPSVGRKIEINTSIKGKKYFISRNKDQSISVAPWCFEADLFEVRIEETILEKLKFKNQKELRKILNKTPRNIICWKFQK